MIDKKIKKKMLNDAVLINDEIYHFTGRFARNKRKIVNLFTYIKYFIKIYILNKCVLPYFEIVLTTKCSLKCKDCGSIMPYYCKPYDVDWKLIKDSLDGLFDNVDEVRMMGVIGGETFMSKDLGKTLEYLVSQRNVGSIRVFTNAVVAIPLKTELLRTLRNNKIHVNISNYGIPESNRFYKYLIGQKVQVRMGGVMKWLDRGDMVPRGRTDLELSHQFQNCYMKTCKSILNGKFYFCPRSGHGHDLGIVNTPPNDYVNILNEKNIREKILMLYYEKKYLAACDFCNVGTDLCLEIPAAIQLSNVQQQRLWSSIKRS